MINLREATIKDLPVLLNFEEKLIEYERSFTPNLKKSDFNYYDLKSYIKNPDISVVVAEEKEKILGSGYALVRENKIYKNPKQYVFLGFMYVIPESRGYGINQKIIRYLFNWGEKKGHKEFQLDVYAPNKSTIKAYQKAGFTFETITMRINFDE